MKIKYLYALLLGVLIYSCDDSTTGIGDSTIASGDSIPGGFAVYEASTRSILADSVYARTSTAYLGKYTDPQFGEFTADFIAQFNCGDNFEFPSTINSSVPERFFEVHSTSFDTTERLRILSDVSSFILIKLLISFLESRAF